MDVDRVGKRPSLGLKSLKQRQDLCGCLKGLEQSEVVCFAKQSTFDMSPTIRDDRNSHFGQESSVTVITLRRFGIRLADFFVTPAEIDFVRACEQPKPFGEPTVPCMLVVPGHTVRINEDSSYRITFWIASTIACWSFLDRSDHMIASLADSPLRREQYAFVGPSIRQGGRLRGSRPSKRPRILVRSRRIVWLNSERPEQPIAESARQQAIQHGPPASEWGSMLFIPSRESLGKVLRREHDSVLGLRC